MSKVEILYYPVGWSNLRYISRWGIVKKYFPDLYTGYLPIVFYRRLPDSWNKLNLFQLKSIIYSRFILQSEFAKMAYLMFKFLRLPFHVFNDLSQEQVVKFHEYISTVIGEESKLNTILLKKIKGFSLILKKPSLSFKSFYGPGDGGGTMVLLEFIDADAAYNRYMASKDIKHLDELISILYREKDPSVNDKSPDFNGDLRVKYNDWNSDERILYIKNIRLWKKYVVLYQYMGLRNHLEKKFHLTFSYNSNGRSFGKAGFIVSVAGGKFGNESESQQANLIAVLTEIEMNHQQILDNK